MRLNLRRGSGYEQAGAEICRVEVGEVAVAYGPPAGVEVVAEASHRPLLGLRSDPPRMSATAPGLPVWVQARVCDAATVSDGTGESGRGTKSPENEPSSMRLCEQSEP